METTNPNLTTDPTNGILQLKNIHLQSKPQQNRNYNDSFIFTPSKNIIVVGYYGHSNAGDEQYKISISYFFETFFSKGKYNLSFMDCDKLDKLTDGITDEDIIILGGGDVLNEYFIDKIIDRFNGEKPNKIMAFSVGIPYSNILLYTDKLQILDCIFLRTKQDLEIVKKRMFPTQVYYIPDISYLLGEIPVNITSNPITPKIKNEQNFTFGRYPSYEIYFDKCAEIANLQNKPVMATTLSPHQPIEMGVSHIFAKITEILLLAKRNKKTVIGFSLNRHIYSPDKRENYRQIVEAFAFVIYNLVCMNNFFVVLIPFNTVEILFDPEQNTENDVLMNRDVIDMVRKMAGDENMEYILSIEHKLETMEIFSIYRFLDISVPMRFHACLFSIYNYVPLIPIYTTKKVLNVLKDVEWPNEFQYELQRFEDDIPKSINAKHLLGCINQLKNKLPEMTQHLEDMCKNVFMKNLDDNIWNIIHFIINEKPKKNLTETFFSKKNKSNQKIIENIYMAINNYLISFIPDWDTSNFNLEKITNSKTQDDIVVIVSYYLTNKLYSQYNYGLKSKMFQSKYNYATEWEWILKEEEKQELKYEYNKISGENPQEDEDKQIVLNTKTIKRKFSSTEPVEYSHNPTASPVGGGGVGGGDRGLLSFLWGKNSVSSKIHLYDEEKPHYTTFNLHYIDQNDNSNVHRSGWKFVYDNIKCFHSDSSSLYLDLYVDKTFHWEKNNYKNIGLIPYTKPWIGFIHHTFEKEFSDYNNFNLLENHYFIESLKTCKGLFVLTENLKTQLNGHLFKKNIRDIKIFTLVHPTQTENIPMFSYDKFIENPNKKIINVGGWLRNIFSFYFIQLPEKITFCKDEMLLFCHTHTKRTDTVKKAVLVSRNMGNYIPNADFLDKFKSFLWGEKPTRVGISSHPSYISNNNLSLLSDTSSVSSESFCAKTGCFISHISNQTQQHYQHQCQPTSDEPPITHNWHKHLYQHLKYLNDSVELIGTLENDDFDVLLTNNIIFINLAEPSAVNTLIECIVRNTPIIINRHPAVVEMLGNDYPLYFDTEDTTDYFNINSQVVELFKDSDSIYRAYKYLKQMDKTKFQIKTFIRQFQEILGGL